MRDSQRHDWTVIPAGAGQEMVMGGVGEDLTYDEKSFFESFYRAGVRGQPEDRMTIGPITDFESRFHYNCVENAIISAIARRNPPPPSVMVETWRMMQKRRGARLLDIGSGTGHWIDFFRTVFFVSEVVGVEITDSMASFLEQKYADVPRVRILREDIASADFDLVPLGGPFDYITAVGVMFHLVDDTRCQRALSHLARALAADGFLFITGDFGAETRNVQFHKQDEFQKWDAQQQTDASDGTIRVNKRLRSLADWHPMAAAAGLRIADLVRTPREPAITTPENDLLVLVPGPEVERRRAKS